MASICCTIATFFFGLLLIEFLSSQVFSIETNYTFEASDEIQDMKMIKEYLQMINKPAKKNVMNPDDDIIDCVLFHEQSAFDNPLLEEKIPKMEPLKRTNGLNSTREAIKNFQLWNTNGKKCPQGTIPIRKITEEDVLSAPLPARFRKKPYIASTTNADAHEHAITTMPFGRYFGAKAALNVWAPHIGDHEKEFSLSQIWFLAGTYGVDLNSIEVGWHAFPYLYGDAHPRLFVYWTADAYANTGCYNTACPGFVQTHSTIVVGEYIITPSTYNGTQKDIIITVERDPRNGNWLLLFGPNREMVGYWPNHLFTYLRDSASLVQFGGEIIDSRPSGVHTTTQMGSGHFSREKFRKAAYVRILEVLGPGNVPLPHLHLAAVATNPRCYDVELDSTVQTYGAYFYFGGPGLSNMCR